MCNTCPVFFPSRIFPFSANICGVKVMVYFQSLPIKGNLEKMCVYPRARKPSQWLTAVYMVISPHVKQVLKLLDSSVKILVKCSPCSHQTAYFWTVLWVLWATFNAQNDLSSWFFWSVVPSCLGAFTHSFLKIRAQPVTLTTLLCSPFILQDSSSSLHSPTNPPATYKWSHLAAPLKRCLWSPLYRDHTLEWIITYLPATRWKLTALKSL